jgi:hypothetical protein
MAEKAMSKKNHLAEQVLDEAQKTALPKEYLEAVVEIVVSHGVGVIYGWGGSKASVEIAKTLRELLTRSAHEKSMAEKITQLDRRTRRHSWLLAKMETNIRRLTEPAPEIETGGGINGGQEWPLYATKDFETIVQRTRDIENAGGDSSQMLYCMIELETLLDAVAKKARATGRKYEGRLAASLRDVCRIYEPDEISEEQAKRFGACVRALIEGWGGLNREKVSLIRSKLLEVGLTWLPVTRKAQKEIEEAKRSNSTANG